VNNMAASIIVSIISIITVIGLFSLLIDCFHVEYIDEILINNYETNHKDDYELVNNDYEYDDYSEE
jgi:hypothetical protein